jgi:hypothetical protein
MLITVEIPEQLGRELQPYRERLPELLERGLREIQSVPTTSFQDVEEIVRLLASQPTAEQILAIKPSANFQARVSDLLSRSKEGTLTRQEEAELERYLTLEHLVRVSKTHALEQLSAAS